MAHKVMRLDNPAAARKEIKLNGFLQEDGKIRYARNPDFVLDYSPPCEKGASIILSKDKQDQSQRWSIYF